MDEFEKDPETEGVEDEMMPDDAIIGKKKPKGAEEDFDSESFEELEEGELGEEEEGFDDVDEL